MLPVNCIPCPAPVRHAAHHAARHIRRALKSIGRRMHRAAHHVAHHTSRIVAYGCCAAAVGGLGGALVAPPGGYFVPPEIAEAQPANTTQGWPEMPAYSGIGGGGAAFIPIYSNARPQLLQVSPPIGGTRGTTPPINTTSIPEPSSVALFLLPGLWVLLLRRRMRA